ncbi:MAG: hypothetical protein VXX85_06065, partial [Candidatus Margulisiibacteriota bacterium]|nr:hypothetical protein [Candidatus Margulisiibacteriota bacterium]
APLFKSFFSVQSYQQPNQKTEKNFHTNLNVIIQQFINDIFSEYKNLFFSQLYTMLKSNNVPQKNKYNYLLHPFWNDFFEFSLVFQTLSLARKNKIIHHLQKTHYLPTSHAEFTQFNQVLNQLSPPPFSLKIASHQMQEPIQMCKKECLAFIRQSMGGTLNTHLTNPIDEHCWIRIKTYFKLIKSKTNQKVN